MQRFSTKYQQTEFNNTLKGSYTMIKRNLFQDARMIQYLQIDHVNKLKNK